MKQNKTVLNLLNENEWVNEKFSAHLQQPDTVSRQSCCYCDILRLLPFEEEYFLFKLLPLEASLHFFKNHLKSSSQPYTKASEGWHSNNNKHYACCFPADRYMKSLKSLLLFACSDLLKLLFHWITCLTCWQQSLVPHDRCPSVHRDIKVPVTFYLCSFIFVNVHFWHF